MTKKHRSAGPDHSWLQQFDVEGPFLSLPVVKGFWPNGIDRLGDADDRLVTFKQGFTAWLRAYDQQSLEKRDQYTATTQAWIDTVLDQLAGWSGLRIDADKLPAEFEIHSPGEQVRIRAQGGLRGRETGEVAALLRVAAPSEDLRGPGLDGWAATEIDRMAALLRKAGLPIGIVTDGRWWAIVWAEEGKATGSGVVDAVTWGEEPLLRDAFLTLIDQKQLRAKNPEHRLPHLLQRSELEAEEVTEALGTQVRRSVELLVQSFSETRLGAAERSEPDPLTENPDDIYQAAVTVMMRVVFLLFAEEQGMLPTERLYWDSYAIRDLLDDLKERALVNGEEHLDESHDVWHRLLAVSDALYFGVNYDEMRMPAYGGSLLDPTRFPWLTAADQHGLKVQVSDRVMLHMLQSVQEVIVQKEVRRISFRDIDVEQIGYIYEGLLGYTCNTVTGDVVLGLVGKDGEEPEISLGQLNTLRDDASSTKTFVTKLINWVKKNQPAATTRTVAQLTKLTNAEIDEAELRRLLTPVAGHDPELLANLIRWGNLIRRDLRGLPLVIPPGGLVVVETQSRRNAGAHYTPRALAEEVVKYALEPLVYEPGPLQTNDGDAWKLMSSTAILDLKVADIAVGSGAFLVAAARFLAKRLTEAWTDEEMLSDAELGDPPLAQARAIREVVARCLYGADINPMAVEMCKLSLWLVSLDKSKPFSFVDDKIFCGHALLGVTSIDQLRHLHVDPDEKQELTLPFVDVDAVLAEATRLRRELASPIEESDAQRSAAGKRRLLKRAGAVTAQLRLIADGIIAAGLAVGGKPGTQLENAYKTLEFALVEAFPQDGSAGNGQKVNTIVTGGLTPAVDIDYEYWQPLHWAIEVPDVMERGGFDAIIGNPPFLGGKKISGSFGSNVREFIVNSVAKGIKGESDLVGYFFLRAASLLAHGGAFGLIASESLSEGETRRVVMEPLLDRGVTIYVAEKRRKWPSTAQVHVSMVWATTAEINSTVERLCDGHLVSFIGPSLDAGSRSFDSPARLNENRGISFMGSILSGQGFVLDPFEYEKLIASDPCSSTVCRPYIAGAKEINQSPRPGPVKYVIDFGDLALEEASRYPGAIKRVRELVKPKRDAAKKAQYRERWWQFAERGKGLQEALSKMQDVLTIVLHSDTLMPVRIDSGCVFSNALGIIGLSDYGSFAVLSSSIHQLWAMRWGSSLDASARYTLSDVFETFPRPNLNSKLHEKGEELDRFRRSMMVDRGIGITELYEGVHDPKIIDDHKIGVLRSLHAAIDREMLKSYGWDLDASHGFYVFRGLCRYSLPPAYRERVLDLLLAENHKRAQLEGALVADAQEGMF